MTLEPDTLGERSSARQALAAAIAAVAAARERLAEAKRAAETGLERSISLQARIDALRARTAFASHRPPADDAIAAILRGDVPGPNRSPAQEARAAIEELQHELDTLRRARADVDDEIGRRKSALGLAEMRVKRMAAAVLRASGAAERLLAGLADLESQVVDRRLGLRFLLAQDAITDGDRAAVEALLERNALPTIASHGDCYGWDRHPGHVAWAEAIKSLHSDPDAPLPV